MEWRALFGLPTKEQEIIAEAEAEIKNELNMLTLERLCMQQDEEWLVEFFQVLEGAVMDEVTIGKLKSLCKPKDEEWFTEFLQVLGKSVTGELTIGMPCVLIEDGKVTDVET